MAASFIYFAYSLTTPLEYNFDCLMVQQQKYTFNKVVVLEKKKGVVLHIETLWVNNMEKGMLDKQKTSTLTCSIMPRWHTFLSPACNSASSYRLINPTTDLASPLRRLKDISNTTNPEPLKIWFPKSDLLSESSNLVDGSTIHLFPSSTQTQCKDLLILSTKNDL